MAENPVLEEVPNEGLDEFSPIEKEFTEAEAVSGRMEEAAGIVDSIGKVPLVVSLDDNVYLIVLVVGLFEISDKSFVWLNVGFFTGFLVDSEHF